MSADGGLHDGLDVLEDVALGEDVAAGANFESVAGVVVPVVVDLQGREAIVSDGVNLLCGQPGPGGLSYGVQEGAALDLG